MDPWDTFLSNIRLIDVGATGLLALAVLLILTGRLVPKSALDAWRDAYLTERKASLEKDTQIALLSQSAAVTARVLDALPVTGGESDESDPKASRHGT